MPRNNTNKMSMRAYSSNAKAIIPMARAITAATYPRSGRALSGRLVFINYLRSPKILLLHHSLWLTPYFRPLIFARRDESMNLLHELLAAGDAFLKHLLHRAIQALAFAAREILCR